MTTFPRMAVVLVLALLMLGAGCTSQQKQAPAVPGNPAPAFSLNDVDGKPVRLSDLAGNVVVLDFWATRCDPCKKSMPPYRCQNRNDLCR